MLPIALAALALLLLVPAPALADGLPAAGIDASPVHLAGGQREYQTDRLGRETLLVESARYGGPLRQRRLRGVYSIPAVAYDGSASGLSADGRTLVLISPRRRFPRKWTTFAVVDTGRLQLRHRIRLRGDFSFDAISPDGRTIYLIRYSRRSITDYEVRAYDPRARRLLPRPVVDASEAGEQMTGVPVTRVASRDGRWAYTLYDGRKHPFVHALDTERRTAVCIDLDDLREVWGTTLELRGSRLELVGSGGRVRAAIDTRTHRLILPAAEHRGGTSWLPIAAPTAVLLLLAVSLRRLVSARGAASREDERTLELTRR
jgi:hypothetical protein